MFPPSDCKDTGIIKFDFVAKTQFLYSIDKLMNKLRTPNVLQRILVYLGIGYVKDEINWYLINQSYHLYPDLGLLQNRTLS